MTVREGDWWLAQIDLSSLDFVSPLAVSVDVKHAGSCSEGANKDGSCRFGLKVFGSVERPVWYFDPTSQGPASASKVWMRQIGGSYALIASACYLRTAVNHTFHLSVWGWDGINEISVLAAPITSITEPLCQEQDPASAAASAVVAASVGAAAAAATPNPTDAKLGPVSADGETVSAPPAPWPAKADKPISPDGLVNADATTDARKAAQAACIESVATASRWMKSVAAAAIATA